MATTGYFLDPANPGTIQRNEIPHHDLGPNEVRIAVRAASLNRRDLMLLDGTYPLPMDPRCALLSDGAGEVIEIGDQVTRTKIGDRVAASYFRRWIDGEQTIQMAMEQHGSSVNGLLAESTVVDEQSVVHIPANLSFAEAACLPCAGVTAWAALHAARGAGEGDNVLVVGSGGVAIFAVQLAAALGARVIAVTSDDDRAEKLRKLGAAEVLNRRTTPDWEQEVRTLTSGQGAQFVVDAVGPATLEKSLASASFHGVVSLVGAFTAEGQTIDAARFNMGYYTLRHAAVGSRTQFEAMNTVIESRDIHPVIDRTFGYDDAAQAFEYLNEAAPFGKVVVSIQ
jgi:NADPH:quinone reductase-like Zn-dependent oxidoreductase